MTAEQTLGHAPVDAVACLPATGRHTATIVQVAASVAASLPPGMLALALMLRHSPRAVWSFAVGAPSMAVG